MRSSPRFGGACSSETARPADAVVGEVFALDECQVERGEHVGFTLEPREATDIAGERHGYLVAGGCQFRISVLGAAALSSSVLIRNRPSGATSIAG